MTAATPVQARFEERFRVLSKATRCFAQASQSSAELLETVVREVAEGIRGSCVLSLISDDGLHCTTPHVHAIDPALKRKLQAIMVGARRIDGHPAIKYVVETGRSFFPPALDVSGMRERVASDVRGIVDELRIATALVVPLLENERVIGTLGISRYGDDVEAFDEDDLALAESLAQHAALSLASARLLERLASELRERERMAARLRLLADAAHEFSEATGDFDRLLAAIARRLGEVLGDLCSIRSVDEQGVWLETGQVYHRDPEVVARVRRLAESEPQRVGEGLTGRVAASRQPLLVPVLGQEQLAAVASPTFHAFLQSLDVGSLIAAPMLCRDRVVGVAVLLRSGTENPYTEDDLHLVRGVVHHAGIAIANARSYAAECAAREAAVAANEALNASEVAQRLLFDANPVPLLVFDLDSLLPLAVNDAALQLYGYTREVFMGNQVSALTGETEATTKARVLALPQAELRGITRQHVREDGTPLVIEYRTRPLDFAGHHARISVLNDVTARYEAEQTRALLASIVESSTDAIVSKRLDGTITSWNRAAERLFGYPAHEAIGQNIRIVFPEDRLNEEVDLMRRIGAGQFVEPFETVRRRRDGSPITVSISLAPVLDTDGKVVGASKTARDLSAQRRAEDALRRTEEQLRQSQKMEAVGRLAGGIAHDFNNLLSVILSYSDLIAAELRPADPNAADIAEVRKAALSAAQLTRQLLVFSRQQVAEPIVLDLNRILSDVDKMLRRILGEDIDLVALLASDLGRVLVDPSNVEQVIMNLAVNARDAMPTGGKLTLETSNIELDEEYAREHLGSKPGMHVMLAVTDTGTGMDSATQARIFEPFFTTKEVGKGTGLGLSTVFGIVQQAGGSVWVYSELGKGTTVKVYLPQVDGEPEERRSSLPTMSTLRGTETILLVEDQEQVRAVAHGILKRQGYQVIVAQNAGEALLVCETHPGTIDLLLTDVVMPHLSGAELAKRVTRTRPETRVLCMSGYTDDSVVRHGVLENGVPFLQKPFTPESLARKVRQVLNGDELP